MDNKDRDKNTEEPSVDTSTTPKQADDASTGEAKPATGSKRRSSRSSRSGGSGRSTKKTSAESKGGSADKPAGGSAPKADTAKEKPVTPGKTGASESGDQPAKPGQASDAASKDKSGGSTTAGKGAASAGGKTVGRPPRRAATYWLVAAICVLFALAAGGGWQLWQLKQAQQELRDAQASDQSELGDRLDTLAGQLDDTQGAIESLKDRDEAIRDEVESSLSKQLDSLSQRQDGLDQRVARIDDRLSRGEIAWKTAEVGFLITRAQERLVIARDPDGAVLALRLADERVAALSRPHWLPLRSAISDAIASIEDAGEGDRVGQALALRRLGDRVGDWPLAGREGAAAEEQPAAPVPNDSTQPADAAWYEKAWSATTGWLSRQVTVTRSDRPVRLRERVATDREMRLWLTAVRESLLSRDQEALVTTLDQARDWLTAHYAVDATGPSAALDAIQQVRERFAGREFPSLDVVLQAWERASAHEKARAANSDAATTGKEAQ